MLLFTDGTHHLAHRRSFCGCHRTGRDRLQAAGVSVTAGNVKGKERHRRRGRAIAASATKPAPTKPAVSTSYDVRDGHFARALPFAVALTAFVMYTATAARDVVVGDSGEFLTAAATLGVAHPSGYPLLVLLGHVFSWLPVGPLAFRINLLAAVCGAVTVGLVFSTARRLGADAASAAIAALALAFSPLFWEWSLAIEAFPLNDAIAAAIIYFLIRWEAEPTRPVFLVVAALCGGLGAANHLTIVFLVPFTILVMWRCRARINARVLSACVAAVCAGLLPYLYIPWASSRHPLVNWGSISSAADLVRHFLRSDYGTGRLVAAGAASGSPVERLIGFAASFSVLQAALAFVGAIEAYRSKRWYFWACASSFLLAGPIFVAYANIDVSNAPLLWALRRFFLLSHVLVAPVAALGAMRLMQIAASRVAAERHQTLAAVITVSVFALIAGTAAFHYSTIDQRRNHVARHFAEDVLVTLQPNTVLLGLGDEIVFPVAYLQGAEKQRPDVTLVMLGLFRSFEWYVAQLRARDPSLVIPFDRYDPGNPAATLRALVEANPMRHFALVGAPIDASLTNAFWLFHTGLVEQIEPMTLDIGLAAASDENDRLLRLYRLPDHARIRRNTFEIGILAKYANGPASMGDQFALAHLDRDAANWYRRALAIDPDDDNIQRALAKLSSQTSR